MSPEHREVAEQMLAAARADLAALQLLAEHPDQADAVVGFHAQQTCEKAFKAVLAAHEIELEYSHRLGLLIERLRAGNVAVPDDLADADWLTAWAVTKRYDATAAELDRPAAVTVAVAALSWARSFV